MGLPCSFCPNYKHGPTLLQSALGICQGRLAFARSVINLTVKIARGGPGPLERRPQMAMEICWLDNLAQAQETARKINKPILLDFYNPQ